MKSISSSSVVYDNSKYSPTENMYNQMKSISSSSVVYDNSKYSPTENIVKYIIEENGKIKKVKDIYRDTRY